MRQGVNIPVSGMKALYALLLNFGVRMEVTGLCAMFLVINFDLRLSVSICRDTAACFTENLQLEGANPG